MLALYAKRTLNLVPGYLEQVLLPVLVPSRLKESVILDIYDGEELKGLLE